MLRGSPWGLTNCCLVPPPPSSSEEYIAAHLNLARSYPSRFDKYIIPCLVASGDIDEKRGAENMNFRYVVCRIRRPRDAPPLH